MEMNTRLQVEHPVTEAVTGTDLVEWQMRVASGEELPLRQEEIGLCGHAIEARLYAENPERGFLPATGMLHGLHLPDGEGVRVDTGVREGDAVTPHYDPLIAKIIACGEDRAAARTRLAAALADTAVLGVATNLGFLHRIVTDEEFAAATLDTVFIDRRRPALLPGPRPAPDLALAAAALWRLTRPPDAKDPDRLSPWARRDGWRLNLAAAPQRLDCRCGEEALTIEATAEDGGWRLLLRDAARQAAAERLADGRFAVTLDGTRHAVRVLEHDCELAVFAGGKSWTFETVDALAPPAGAEAGGGHLTAPMPGRVVQLLVAPGETVKRGQAMMVIEAMKMEHTISAPRDGIVESVRYAAGDLVEEGAELIALKLEEAKTG